jgi:hypothetical protein
LGEGGELGKVVVGDQRPVCLHKVTGLEEFLALLGEAALVGVLSWPPSFCSLTKASNAGRA